MPYYAHSNDKTLEKQTILEHLKGTAKLAAKYAKEFGEDQEAYCCGKLHDIGKYSEAFQRRLMGGNRVDHSTAGAQCDHSAARGKMAEQQLIIFRHNSEFGNAPAHKLFDCVKVRKKESVQIPRNYHDYTITVDEASIPNGVEVTMMG